MTSEAYASWEIMSWIMRREVLGQIFSFPFLGKQLYFCSLEELVLIFAALCGIHSSSWELCVGEGIRVKLTSGFPKTTSYVRATARGPHDDTYQCFLCGVTCGARAGQDEESWSCPVIYTSLLPSCALVSSLEKNEWDKLSTVHTGFTVGESAWVLTHK